MNECQKIEEITRKAAFRTVTGVEFEVTQRGLTIGEERAARRISGYSPSIWDTVKLREFLTAKGVEKIIDLSEDDQIEAARIAKLDDPSNDDTTYRFMLLRICFSMGGKVDGIGAGDMGLGEGWTLEDSITPDSIERAIRDQAALNLLGENLNELSSISSIVEKK